MSSEISFSASVQVSKNGATFSARADEVLDQTGNQCVNNVQAIGTSAELLALGDISGVPKVYFVQNLDSANYVELALDSGMTQKFAKIIAGGFALITPSVAAVYARANTASVNCLVLAAEA